MTEGTRAELTSGDVLARNTIWNIVGQVAPMLAALLAIPVTLRGLGTERFGALSLAWLLIGYFGLFDLGLGRALTKLSAEKLGRGQDDEIPALAWTALFLMFGLGVAGAVLITLPSAWLLERALRIPPPLRAETQDALLVLAASLPFVISTAGLRGLLEAKQRFGLVNAVRIPMGVFTFVGPILVLPFSRSLVAVVGLLALGRFVGWAVHVALCFRVFPALRQRLALDPPLIAPLVKFGGWMTVTNVVGPLMVYLDRFLIGSLVSLTAVAYYAAPYEMVTRLLVVPSAIAQVLFPAFAQSLVEDRPRAGLLFDRGVKTVFLSLFPPVLLLVALAPEVLRLWLGPEFSRESARVLQWLAVGVFINGLAQIPFALVQGAGRPELTARLHLVELPFYLVAVWWLIRAQGVSGAAIAWTARAAVDAAVLLLMAARTVPAPPGARWRTASLVTGLAACVLGSLLDTGPQKQLFLAGTLAAFAVLSWAFILTVDERLSARSFIERIAAPSRAQP